jgi:hypothetical protein
MKKKIKIQDGDENIFYFSHANYPSFCFFGLASFILFYIALELKHTNILLCYNKILKVFPVFKIGQY